MFRNKRTMELNTVEVWDGNLANSHALRQASVDVVAAYPITPSTGTVEGYAMHHANGYVDGEFVMVESEHAAMSGCIGASAAGARAATATSSQGLALMVETLYQASGMRMPIVLCMINRALAAPLNVNGEHSDMYLANQSGWISMDACTPEESYDLVLCAFRIAEHKDVRLPVIVNQDGFLTSHKAQNVRPLSDKDAYDFVGDYQEVNSLLNFDKPVTHGVQTESDWHFEHKAKQHDAMMKSTKVIEEVFEEYAKLSGRKYNMLETYLVDDADVVIVCLGTTYQTAQMAADQLRAEGKKVGVLMPRVFRPTQLEMIAKTLKNVKGIVCMDRSAPGGQTGLIYNDVAAALFNTSARPLLSNVIYGLGGRDINIVALKGIFNTALEEVSNGKLNGSIQRFVGVRGPELKYYSVEA
ncbi:MAG: 2-oxoacid:ferredoxin oxidoreductase subunit alpha [Arcobacteraceae bacterium]|jgi:pyruvate ferredoxin oxidoreductase alpha subunit|nr:2-oxoacid:ferredoxin oxidoreductase subunit alpha [Arcobacteraceae bacterium]